jgi:hypothetical protein
MTEPTHDFVVVQPDRPGVHERDEVAEELRPLLRKPMCERAAALAGTQL